MSTIAQPKTDERALARRIVELEEKVRRLEILVAKKLT